MYVTHTNGIANHNVTNLGHLVNGDSILSNSYTDCIYGSTFVVFIECPLRFSRLTLNVDTGVSTIGFVENGDEGFEIAFEATSFPLPIVQGPADYPLPAGCEVNSLAVNRATGWITIDHGGFNLYQNGNDTFLLV